MKPGSTFCEASSDLQGSVRLANARASGRASRSARSAFVSFFFAIVISKESFDVRECDRYIAHVEE